MAASLMSGQGKQQRQRPAKSRFRPESKEREMRQDIFPIVESDMRKLGLEAPLPAHS